MNNHSSKDHKWRIFGVILIIYFFLGLLSAMPVEALRLKTNWGERVDLSEEIVRGEVIEVTSYWNTEKNLIYTDVTVLVDEHLKGNGLREIKISIPGGTVGDQTHWVSDTPQFEVGDYGVILLESSGQVTGGPDGVYLLQKPMAGTNQFLATKEDSFLSWIKSYINGQTDVLFEDEPEESEETSTQLMLQETSYATISGVSPSTISAGTNSVLTISGSGFGNSRGSGSYPTIAFRFKGNGYMYNNSYFESWSDTQIKVIVPTGIVDNYFHSPGSWSNTVAFINGSGGFGSFYALTIPFGYGAAEWNTSPVPYNVNETSGPTGSVAAIQAAANTWSAGGADFSFSYAGATELGWGQDGYNVISFANFGSSTIIGWAILYVSGEIATEADIQFNTGFAWSTNPTPPSNKMDLQSIAVHELGHWLRLLDLYGVNDAKKVMYGYGSYGQKKRTLALGDKQGIQWIYPPDLTAPTPNPMTWATLPSQVGTNSISMIATAARDPRPPISYYFDFVNSTTGGSGGADSGWQSGTSYTNTNLKANHRYGYRVKAKDGLNNQTAYSTIQYAYTAIEAPTGITFGAVTSSSIQVRSTNTPSGLTRGSSGLWIENMTHGTNSGWKRNNALWNSKTLLPNTSYGFRAKARNGDGVETDYGPSASKYTRANLPGVASFSNVTRTSIRANWTANDNPSGTLYFCQNVTTGANSGWITNTYWESDSLSYGKSYSFKVKAKNGEGIETGWTSLGKQTTVGRAVIVNPNGGPLPLKQGEIIDIAWTAYETTQPITKVHLYYTKDGGATYNSIITLTGIYPPRDYSQTWKVPPVGTTPKTKCKVKVVLKDEKGVIQGSDVSDNYFTIEPLVPDLIETTVSDPPTTALPGGSFSVTDTVENRGDADAGPSTTQYYLSVNTTKGTGDILLTGTRSVPALVPGATSTGTMDVTIPSSTAAGTYYLLACADDKKKVAESNETNNCVASTSTMQVTRPDLIETSVSNPPTASLPGKSFSVTDTAKNQGKADAGTSTTQYYLSVNTSKGTDDILLKGTRPVPALAPEATSTGTVEVTIPSGLAAGAYYLLACADDLKAVAESNETNNCIASTSRVQISGPDLIETYVTNPPPAVKVGSTFSVTDTVKNQGNVDAGPSSVTQYYLSVDKIKDSEDIVVGGRWVIGLVPGATSLGRVDDVTIPPGTAAGAYYLLACADDMEAVDETDEKNNCIASGTTVQVIP